MTIACCLIPTVFNTDFFTNQITGILTINITHYINLLDSRRLRMIQVYVYVWPHVTLNFDLPTPKIDRSIPLPSRLLVPIGIKTGSPVFKTPCSQVKWMDEQADRLRTLCFQLPVWPGKGTSDCCSKSR